MKYPELQTELSIWAWLVFPVLFLVFIVAVAMYDFETAHEMVARENNLVELGTVVLLIPGIIAGLKCLKSRTVLPERWLYVWIALVTLGCIYLGGEELSWGQQLFKWETPESIQALNDQNETNLHNISSWLDQKPRLLLEIAVLIGGVLLPVWRKIRRTSFVADNWRYWLWPGLVCLPSAVIAIVVKIPERLKDFFDYVLFEKALRYSELQEFYFALFLSIYLCSVYKRLSHEAANTR